MTDSTPISAENHPNPSAVEQDRKLQRFSNFLLVLSVVVLIFASGYRLGEARTRKSNQVPSVSGAQKSVLSRQQTREGADMQLFWTVWDLITSRYADQTKVKPQEMVYGAIKGLVASLGDPYSYFMTPSENQKSKDDLGGKYEGIGAELGMKDSRVIVVAPLDNSPAKKAGVTPGDVILAVDGVSTKGWTITQAVEHIRGEANTSVKLMLLRGEKQLELTIERQQIKVDSVKLSYKKLKGCEENCRIVADIQVTHFGDDTTVEWNKAVAAVKNRYNKGEITGLIVDVRGNPGGYLDGAVYLSEEFLQSGALVVKQEYADQPAKEYRVTRNGQLPKIPVVVLINEGSASASEIFSGALRDHNRARLIGRKSFGKGSVQEALDLTSDTGLHLTIAKWVLPNGDWINSKGIEPDENVELKIKDGNTLNDNNDAQLQAGISYLLK